MANVRISQLPLYTGNTSGSFFIMNNSGETQTYKVQLETVLQSGTSGTSGTSGSNGSSGTSGINGTSGTSGTSGSNGSSGTSGSNGSSGTSGINGTSGTSGSNGSSGTSGQNGLGLPSKVIELDGTWISPSSFPYKNIVFDFPFSNNNYSIDIIFTFPSYYSESYTLDLAQVGTFGLTITNKTASGFTINADNGSGNNVNLTGYTDFSGYATCIQTGSSNGSGLNGSSGTSGTSGINGTSGTSGIDGTSGTSGSSGVSGTSGTSGSSGVNGNPGTSGTSGTSGSSGVSGTSGTSGSSGVSGTSGTSGSSGVSGTSGTSGSSGVSGTSGTSGIDGTSGTSGTSGINGAPGTSGTSGTSGSSGVSGTSGTSGSSGSATITNNTDNYVLTATGTSDINGEANLRFNGSVLSVTGSVEASGNVIAYTTSDERQKSNIQPIVNALEKVKKLNGVTWEWNPINTDYTTQKLPKTGLIAQDVQKVLPEVVKEKLDGFLSVDYEKIIGLLVEAIKELEQKIK